MKPKTVKVFATLCEEDDLVSFHLTKPTVESGMDWKAYTSNSDAWICRKVAEKLYGGNLPKTFEDGIVTFNIARVK